MRGEDHSLIETELDVLAVLRARGGIEVPNLSWITALDDGQYASALRILEEIVDRDIADAGLRFWVRMRFSDARAKLYYRRIFAWYTEATGDVERPSLEWALARTYSNRECAWTWEQLGAMPREKWPIRVLRQLWKDGAPVDEIRAGVIRMLRESYPGFIDAMEVAKFEDAGIRNTLLTVQGLPSRVKRYLQRAAGGPTETANFELWDAKQFDAYSEVFSAEVDDDETIDLISEMNQTLGWSAEVVEFELDRIPIGGAAAVWREAPPGSDRVILVHREDDTTLVVRWLLGDPERPTATPNCERGESGLTAAKWEE